MTKREAWEAIAQHFRLNDYTHITYLGDGIFDTGRFMFHICKPHAYVASRIGPWQGEKTHVAAQFRAESLTCVCGYQLKNKKLAMVIKLRYMVPDIMKG